MNVITGRGAEQGDPRPGRRGRLHIFLAATPRAGKTYAMLAEGSRRAAAGDDVVVGLVETHSRSDVANAAQRLDAIPLRRIDYRGTVFEEPDYEAVRARRPDVVLIDELAHTNVPGCRHQKRWQDVNELLDAGIDVMTTLNIGHLAGLHEHVEQITGVNQHEFVPDELVLGADRVQFIDADPEIVRARLGQNGRFFNRERLRAMRELALEWLSQHGFAAPHRGQHQRRAPRRWWSRWLLVPRRDGWCGARRSWRHIAGRS